MNMNINNLVIMERHNAYYINEPLKQFHSNDTASLELLIKIIKKPVVFSSQYKIKDLFCIIIDKKVYSFSGHNSEEIINLIQIKPLQS